MRTAATIFTLLFYLFSNNLFTQEEDKISSVFLPLKVSNKVIRDIIVKATPATQKIRGRTRTKKYSVTLNAVDKETAFTGNSITHNMRIKNGGGYYKTRGYTRVLGRRVYGPWVKFNIRNIRGNAQAKVSITLNNDYSLFANTTAKAKIDNIDVSGINATTLIRAFGLHTFKSDLTKSVNKELGKLNFRNKTNKIWEDLKKPIQLDENNYVLIEPLSFLYQDLSFGNDHLNLGLGLNFKVQTGNKEEAELWDPAGKLPNLIKVNALPQNTIDLNAKLNISLNTLEEQAKKHVIGQYITRKKKNGKIVKYAKVLDVTIDQSPEDQFDIQLGLNVKVLRPIFRKKKGFVYLNTKLDYNKENEELFVDDFKIDSQINSWLANNSLEFLANVLVYNKIKDKMKFDIDKELDKEKNKINAKLSENILLSDGIFLKGVLTDFEVGDIQTLEDIIAVDVNLKGNISIDVTKLNLGAL